jgi:hypothetical protein
LSQKQYSAISGGSVEGANIPSVFLSYGREDEASAKRLYNALRRTRVDVWFDRKALLPGDRWRSSLTRALRQADFVIILLSQRSSSRRGFFNREIKEALDISDEMPESRAFLIVARLDDCKPGHSALLDFQWVDLFPNWKEGFRQIRKTLDLAQPGRLRPQVSRAFMQVVLPTLDRSIIAQILRIPNVLSVDEIFGVSDLMIIVEAETDAQLIKAINSIQSLGGLGATQTNQSASSVKRAITA